MSQTEPNERVTGFWVTGIDVFLLWKLFTLVGAFFGQTIDPLQWGLDGLRWLPSLDCCGRAYLRASR